MKNIGNSCSQFSPVISSCAIWHQYRSYLPDTDASSQHALRCHENMICTRIFQKLLSDKNFISIHFDAQGTTNLASNIHFAVDTKNELERFIRLLWGIPKYQLGKECPQKNTIEVYPDLERRILSKINNIMATFHQECLISLCCKVCFTLLNFIMYIVNA